MNESTLVHDGMSWTWNGEQRHASGVTYVPVGATSGWWAHALTPHTPSAWVCDDDDGLDAFTSVFGKDWVDNARSVCGRDRDELGAVDPFGLQTPSVNDAWARLVVVRSLARWYPDPIDELALRIDEALAWDAAGDTARATAAITVGLTPLVSIAHVMWNAADVEGTNPLPQFCEEIVERAAALAERLAPADDEDLALLRDVMSHRVALPLRHGEALADEIAAWLESAMLAETAGDRGGDDGRVETVDISPAVVTARVLEWAGPWRSPLEATRAGDTVTVTLSLGPDSHPDDREVRSLAAYACDVDSGEILARTMLRATDRDDRVTGSLHLPEGREAAVGVFELDRIDALRTDPLGRYLSRIDRIALGRWVAQRNRVLATALGSNSPDSVTLEAAADNYTDRCDDQLRAVRVRASADSRLAEDSRELVYGQANAAAKAPDTSGVFAVTLAEALVTLAPDDAAWAA